MILELILFEWLICKLEIGDIKLNILRLCS